MKNLTKSNAQIHQSPQFLEEQDISDTEITEGLLSLSNFRSSFNEDQTLSYSNNNSSNTDSLPSHEISSEKIPESTEFRINSTMYESTINPKKHKKSKLQRNNKNYLNSLTDFDLNNFNKSLKIQLDNGDMYVPVFKTFQNNLVNHISSFEPKVNNFNKNPHEFIVPKKKFDYEKYRREVMKSYSLSNGSPLKDTSSTEFPLNNSAKSFSYMIYRQNMKKDTKKFDYQKYLAHISDEYPSFP